MSKSSKLSVVPDTEDELDPHEPESSYSSEEHEHANGQPNAQLQMHKTAVLSTSRSVATITADFAVSQKSCPPGEPVCNLDKCLPVIFYRVPKSISSKLARWQSFKTQ